MRDRLGYSDGRFFALLGRVERQETEGGDPVNAGGRATAFRYQQRRLSGALGGPVSPGGGSGPPPWKLDRGEG